MILIGYKLMEEGEKEYLNNTYKNVIKDFLDEKTYLNEIKTKDEFKKLLPDIYSCGNESFEEILNYFKTSKDCYEKGLKALEEGYILKCLNIETEEDLSGELVIDLLEKHGIIKILKKFSE